jgi:antitoxin (DNA-binding transcriptional repressor) of toxin-antitoxin stability system
MKKLNQFQSLEGQSETISIMEFRQLPGEVFTQVSMGKTFTITKKGIPIAVISKPLKEKEIP